MTCKVCMAAESAYDDGLCFQCNERIAMPGADVAEVAARLARGAEFVRCHAEAEKLVAPPELAELSLARKRIEARRSIGLALGRSGLSAADRRRVLLDLLVETEKSP